MDRTKERIFSIIGMSMDGIFILAGLVFSIFLYLTRASFFPLDFSLLDFFKQFIGGFAIFFVAIIVIIILFIFISFTLGLVGILKLNTNPRLSGYLFISAAIIHSLTFISFLREPSAFIPVQFIAYLTAGILCLRKNEPEQDENETEVV